MTSMRLTPVSSSAVYILVRWSVSKQWGEEQTTGFPAQVLPDQTEDDHRAGVS